MSSKIWVIKTTLPESMNEEEVTSFSHSLIEGGAACIQHHKVTSNYQWEGEMKSESEWSLQIKVSKANKQAVADLIQETHPYEVPQMIMSKWESSQDYLAWVNSQ